MFVLSNSNLQPFTPMIPADRMIIAFIIGIVVIGGIRIALVLLEKKETNKKGEEK
ncbi:hypothetical protein [Bacillus fungorum]|uniref:hypothetical protein n=1 Tax=Bacillus fungorum TaxID=2039284 RepID=UPI00146E54BA|nr:hypothetical protein [Bacillus fungorum]